MSNAYIADLESVVVLELGSNQYPPELQSISSPPRRLYVKGTYNQNLFDNCLGIVGSRKMSSYGASVIDSIIKNVNRNITLVSGFMYGADTKALKSGLDFGFTCVAVLPSGINNIHPKRNTALYYEIIERGGLIMSELDGDTEPQEWSYPRRNRIIAGLCKGIFVVESYVPSGTLITAEYGHKFGKTVFASVGDMFSPLMQGNNHLLSTFAKPLISAHQINDLFNLTTPNEIHNISSEPLLDPSECLILDVIRLEPLGLDKLSLLTEMNISELISKVTQLLIRGYLQERGGKYYVS